MKESLESFDKALVAYQKSALGLFYPALISFFAIAFGFSLSIMGGFSLSGSYTLAFYLSANPIGGNSILSTALSIGVGAVIAVFFGFLTMRAAKGKFYPLPVAFALYLADFAYTIALYFPIYGQMSLSNWVISIVLHLVFLSLFSLTAVKYAKLSRFLKKSRVQS